MLTNGFNCYLHFGWGGVRSSSVITFSLHHWYKQLLLSVQWRQIQPPLIRLRWHHPNSLPRFMVRKIPRVHTVILVPVLKRVLQRLIFNPCGRLRTQRRHLYFLVTLIGVRVIFVGQMIHQINFTIIFIFLRL